MSQFLVDAVNSNDEDFYVDIAGKGTVLIKSNQDGVSIDVYPACLADKPLFSGYLLNSEFEVDKE